MKASRILPSPSRNRRQDLGRVRRLIVKLGTGVVTSAKGNPDRRFLRSLADQIRVLHARKIDVVVVSSGAIGAGMARLGIRKRPTGIHDLQACAAIGQNALMHRYETVFSKVGLMVGQVLLTHGDFYDPKRRDNARQTLLRLLKLGVVPIINENDAVSFAEIKFGDNDQLAAQVHQLIGADLTVLLTNVQGFYVVQGGKHVVLKSVHGVDDSLLAHARDTASHRSVGGMKSKLLAAHLVTDTGHPLIIAEGRAQKILPRLLDGEELGTIFLPAKKGRSRKI